MIDNKGCKARQYGDQKLCIRCNLVWDISDQDPPDCLTEREIALRESKAILHMRNKLPDYP